MTGRHITSFAKRLGLKWKKMANVSVYSELWDIIATSSQPEGRRNSILEMFTMPRHLVFNFAWIPQQSSEVSGIIINL